MSSFQNSPTWLNVSNFHVSCLPTLSRDMYWPRKDQDSPLHTSKIVTRTCQLLSLLVIDQKAEKSRPSFLTCFIKLPTKSRSMCFTASNRNPAFWRHWHNKWWARSSKNMIFKPSEWIEIIPAPSSFMIQTPHFLHSSETSGCRWSRSANLRRWKPMTNENSGTCGQKIKPSIRVAYYVTCCFKGFFFTTNIK